MGDGREELGERYGKYVVVVNGVGVCGLVVKRNHRLDHSGRFISYR